MKRLSRCSMYLQYTPNYVSIAHFLLLTFILNTCLFPTPATTHVQATKPALTPEELTMLLEAFQSGNLPPSTPQYIQDWFLYLNLAEGIYRGACINRLASTSDNQTHSSDPILVSALKAPDALATQISQCVHAFNFYCPPIFEFFQNVRPESQLMEDILAHIVGSTHVLLGELQKSPATSSAFPVLIQSCHIFNHFLQITTEQIEPLLYLTHRTIFEPDTPIDTNLNLPSLFNVQEHLNTLRASMTSIAPSTDDVAAFTDAIAEFLQQQETQPDVYLDDISSSVEKRKFLVPFIHKSREEAKTLLLNALQQHIDDVDTPAHFPPLLAWVIERLRVSPVLKDKVRAEMDSLSGAVGTLAEKVVDSVLKWSTASAVRIEEVIEQPVIRDRIDALGTNQDAFQDALNALLAQAEPEKFTMDASLDPAVSELLKEIIAAYRGAPMEVPTVVPVVPDVSEVQRVFEELKWVGIALEGGTAAPSIANAVHRVRTSEKQYVKGLGLKGALSAQFVFQFWGNSEDEVTTWLEGYIRTQISSSAPLNLDEIPPLLCFAITQVRACPEAVTQLSDEKDPLRWDVGLRKLLELVTGKLLSWVPESYQYVKMTHELYATFDHRIADQILTLAPGDQEILQQELLVLLEKGLEYSVPVTVNRYVAKLLHMIVNKLKKRMQQASSIEQQKSKSVQKDLDEGIAPDEGSTPPLIPKKRGTASDLALGLIVSLIFVGMIFIFCVCYVKRNRLVIMTPYLGAKLDVISYHSEGGHPHEMDDMDYMDESDLELLKN